MKYKVGQAVDVHTSNGDFFMKVKIVNTCENYFINDGVYCFLYILSNGAWVTENTIINAH